MSNSKHRVNGRFVKKIVSVRSKRLNYFNSVNAALNRSGASDHSYFKHEENEFQGPEFESVQCEFDVCQNVEAAANNSLSWEDGRRVIELKHLANQLFCKKCLHPLQLSNIKSERVCGLGSYLHVQCDSPQCYYVNTVTTGKQNSKGVFDINNKATLAMIHCGMGPTHLQNFLAACNIPPPNQSTIKRREKEIASSLQYQAKQSCDAAKEAEKAATETTTLEASFDAGWQTRGSGCQYNSKTGHSSLIGPLTGKILDFDTRSKSCSICQYHLARKETFPQHVCNSNWDGSSKAMESDMAATMLKRLKKDGYEIGTIHADNDSTTTARLKTEFENLEKKCDKNHLKKNISKQLYSLSKTHKELKQEGVILYITKCYMHPLSVKNQAEEEIEKKLDMIVPHIFGDHSICSTSWCAYHKNPEAYRMKYLPNGRPLVNDKLRDALNSITLSLKRISPQLVHLGSTQSNENFNNIVASKAPKNRAYGGTRSLVSRVSAAVLQKNEGYTYINKVNKDALLSPGIVSKLHGIKMDKKKLWNRKRQATIAFKRKRLLLKKRKHNRESALHLREGQTYGSNIESSAEIDIETIPGKLSIKNRKFVIFDIETTGLSRDSDIVQLSAYDGNKEFNIYTQPNQPISKSATSISGISYSFQSNTMYYNGCEVVAETLRLSLLKFIEYLEELEVPILVGHNIMSYDIHILCQKLYECNLLSEFMTHIYGCADTLKISRKMFKKEDVGNYKQSTLVSVLLGKSYTAHNSLADVKALHELFVEKLVCKSEDLFPFHIHLLQKSFKPLIEEKYLSNAISRKLSASGLGLKHLVLAYRRDMNSGVKTLLGEFGFRGKIITKLVAYLEKTEE